MRRFPISLLWASALLLGATACSSDNDASPSDEATSTPASDATTLATGQDVELVGEGLGRQTLDVSAEEADGEVTGEFRVSDVIVRVDCADTDTDGVVILGGEVTTGETDGVAETGELLTLIVVEGDPDRVAVYANDDGAATCTEMLSSVPEDLLPDTDAFVDVAAGSDIQTA